MDGADELWVIIDAFHASSNEVSRQVMTAMSPFVSPPMLTMNGVTRRAKSSSLKRRTRPLTKGQEMLLFGAAFGIGGLLQLLVILKVLGSVQ